MKLESSMNYDETSLDNYIERLMYWEKQYEEIMNFILYDKEITRQERSALFEELDRLLKHLNKLKNVKY